MFEKQRLLSVRSLIERGQMFHFPSQMGQLILAICCTRTELDRRNTRHQRMKLVRVETFFSKPFAAIPMELLSILIGKLSILRTFDVLEDRKRRHRRLIPYCTDAEGECTKATVPLHFITL